MQPNPTDIELDCRHCNIFERKYNDQCIKELFLVLLFKKILKTKIMKVNVTAHHSVHKTQLTSRVCTFLFVV